MAPARLQVEVCWGPTAVSLAPSWIVALAALMMVYLAGLGLVLPLSIAATLQPFPERAGAASSLVGSVQQTIGAIVGAIVGHALGATAWPMIISIAAAGCLTLLLWLTTRQNTNARGQATRMSIVQRRDNSRSSSQPSTPAAAVRLDGLRGGPNWREHRAKGPYAAWCEFYCATGLRSPYFFSTTPMIGPIGRRRSWREIDGAYSAEVEPSRKRASRQCSRSRKRCANWWKVTG